MEAKELMEGDIVEVNGHSMKISELGRTFSELDNGRVVLTEELEPAPITGEILKNNGFQELFGAYAWADENDEDICVIAIPLTMGVWDISIDSRRRGVCVLHSGIHFSAEMSSMHMLQRAMTACEIDKEIEL